MAVMLTQKDAPGRGCKCCPDHGHKPGVKKVMRRQVRRSERAELRRELGR